ncbi:MAG: 30S ribosomal protein S17 [Gammaproteobacteria bacterium]|nr:30S ribosomal protein S17 [Gammaproteobacteria bacterium]
MTTDTAVVENSEVAKSGRLAEGSVTSASMDKTITVLVERKIKHPIYKKYIRRSTKLHAHDEQNICQVGDIVRIEACRPLSKSKTWRLVAVLTKAV